MRRLAAGIAAAVAIGAAAWWLLLGGGAAPVAPGGGGGSASTPRAGGPAPAAPARPAEVPATPPSAADEVPVGPAPGSALPVPVLALLEDGTPLPGVTFLDMHRDEDGALLPYFDRSPNDGRATGVDGRVALAWDRTTPELFLLLPGEQEFLGVEEGAEEERLESGVVVRPAGPGRELRLRFRDPVGATFLLPVSAETGEPLEGREKAGYHWRLRDAEGRERVTLVAGKTADGGWFRPDLRGAPPDEAIAIDVSMPGREPGRVAFADLRGRVRVPLRDAERVVRGEILPPPPKAGPAGEGDAGEEGEEEDAHPALVVDLECAGPPDPLQESRIAGVPGRVGPFEVRGLRPGKWSLRVRHASGAFARREFHLPEGPATVDLGAIRAIPPGSVRVRVLGPSGAPLPGVGVRLRFDSREVAEDESGDGPLRIEDRAGATIVFRGGRRIREFHRGAAAGPDAAGWWTFDGLEPGRAFLASAPEAESDEVRFEVPPEGGPAGAVELRAKVDLVRVRVRFTAEGRPLPESAVFLGAPSAMDDTIASGPMEVDLLPGRYPIVVLSTDTRVPGDLQGGRLRRGTLVVPTAAEYDGAEIVVDLL
jgi:hypothetical protein